MNVDKKLLKEPFGMSSHKGVVKIFFLELFFGFVSQVRPSVLFTILFTRLLNSWMACIVRCKSAVAKTSLEGLLAMHHVVCTARVCRDARLEYRIAFVTVF